MLHESLSLCPTPHPDRSRSLDNLASALPDRFRKTGSMTEAVLIHCESLSLRSTAHPGRRQVLTDLVRALEIRSKAGGIQSDLSAATSLRWEALAMSS